MNNKNNLIVERSNPGVVTLTLNRPEVSNAFDDQLIQQFLKILKELENKQIRLLILKSTGKTFSAGADLNWMKKARQFSREKNLQDARQLAELLFRLNHFPAPTVAAVQGATYGGAVGLISACDIVIATETARFCLSEVRIGLIPAIISPYVIKAMGERQARRYFLSAEVISAQQAIELNLIHQVCPENQLEQVLKQSAAQLLANSPAALREAKKLIQDISGQTIDQSLVEMTCERIADIRVSEEGQEGLAAFLEKREPKWKSH